MLPPRELLEKILAASQQLEAAAKSRDSIRVAVAKQSLGRLREELEAAQAKPRA